MDFCRIELYYFINVESNTVSEFLLESEIGADFWNVSEFLDERVVRTQIVWIIRERVNEDKIWGTPVYRGRMGFERTPDWHQRRHRGCRRVNAHAQGFRVFGTSVYLLSDPLTFPLRQASDIGELLPYRVLLPHQW